MRRLKSPLVAKKVTPVPWTFVMMDVGCRRFDGSAWFLGNIDDFCDRAFGLWTQEAAGAWQISRKRNSGVQKSNGRAQIELGRRGQGHFRTSQRRQERHSQH